MPQRNVASNFTFEQQRVEINNLAQDFWTHKTGSDTAAPTYLKHDGSNAFTGQTLNVPNAFTINSNSGSGTVTISGNLDVTGTTTTVSSANLEVTDKNILIAKGSTSDAQADGAGITIDSATDITFNFIDAKDAWVSSIGLEATTFLKAGTSLEAAYGQFTGSGSPSAGQGIEINAPDSNTGQIISYDRGGSAYKELRVKGSSVGIYGGTTNALVGTFNSTGLDVDGALTVTGNISNSAGQITCGVHGTSGIQIINDGTFGTLHNVDLVLRTNSAARAKLDKSTGDFTLTNTNAKFISESSSATKYLRLYAASGTGQWDIYGNGANLRFSDNANAGSVVFDRNVDANGGLDVTGNLTVSGNSTLGDSTTADTVTVNGSLIQNNNSSETAYASKSLPSGDSGFYIRNGDGGTGTYASLGLIASSTGAGSDQSFSIVAQAQASGLVPKVAFTQRNGNNSQNETMTFTTDNKVVIGTNAAGGNLSVSGNIITDDGTNGRITIQADGTNTNQILSTTTGFGSYCNMKYQAAAHIFLYGGTERFRIEAAGAVLPGADNTQDLGSTTKRWANVYTGDLNLCNEGSYNEVDGTSGSWTMQEGDSDLFLINRKSGKKYKFNLTEVS